LRTATRDGRPSCERRGFEGIKEYLETKYVAIAL